MVGSVNSNTYYYNGDTYVRRNQLDAEIGFWLASGASALLYKALPSFSNPFIRQIGKEHLNNHLYKDAFEKAVEISGLKDKGLEVWDTFFRTAKEKADFMSKVPVVDGDIKAGLNACYIPDATAIKLNKNLATISGFHELGHAMNHLSSTFGKILQKLRGPGYAVAGLMGTVALFSRKKPKDAPKDTFDWIQDNCTAIAVAGMLPTVAEEALASRNGIKLAKQAGLSDALVKNLKKFYGKALLSYAGYAVVTGLSVFAMSKITEAFTRPVKISNPQ